VSTLLAAAAQCGMPLTVLDIQSDEIPPAYKHKLLLNRPDQHVAWRGDALPEDARALVDLVRGVR
jgi:hypothetical protein